MFDRLVPAKCINLFLCASCGQLFVLGERALQARGYSVFLPQSLCGVLLAARNRLSNTVCQTTNGITESFVLVTYIYAILFATWKGSV